MEEKKNNRKNFMWRLFFFLVGTVILSFSITLNTKTGLGVSPIISIPCAISIIWDLDLGNVTFALYAVFIVLQALLRRKLTINMILQLPLSIVVTRLIDLFHKYIPECSDVMAERILVLIAAICLTGIGIILTVQTKFVPNPGDGIVYELSIAMKKNMGFAKNCVDFVSLFISCSLGLIFTGKIVGVGLGTVMTMIFTGRAVALFSYLFLDKLLHLCGLDS
jgi:uncharacterized membrane protein YczE